MVGGEDDGGPLGASICITSGYLTGGHGPELYVAMDLAETQAVSSREMDVKSGGILTPAVRQDGSDIKKSGFVPSEKFIWIAAKSPAVLVRARLDTLWFVALIAKILFPGASATLKTSAFVQSAKLPTWCSLTYNVNSLSHVMSTSAEDTWAVELYHLRKARLPCGKVVLLELTSKVPGSGVQIQFATRNFSTRE